MSPEEGKNDPVNSITKAELKDHTYYLASDFLEGRLTGSEGYKQAAYYVASQLNAAGLQPIAGNYGGKESYLQPIDFVISVRLQAFSDSWADFLSYRFRLS
jgi:hypothetical protein